MKKLSKVQWQDKILDIAENMPQELSPDDQTLAQIITDMVVSEQSRLKPKNLAVLASIAAALFKRVKVSMPAATHVNEKGEKVYTAEEIAAHLGISVEEAIKQGTEMAKASPDGKLVYTDVDPDTVHRLN